MFFRIAGACCTAFGFLLMLGLLDEQHRAVGVGGAVLFVGGAILELLVEIRREILIPMKKALLQQGTTPPESATRRKPAGASVFTNPPPDL